MIDLNKTLLKRALAGVLFAGVAATALAPAFAQTTPPSATAAQPEARHRAEHRLLPGQLVDGRIAFLKAELKITPAQETQWQSMAAAMRDNAQALDQAITTAHQNRGAMDAVQRLSLRESFARVRAENEARLLAAFKPLYASLSPEQQQTANQLLVSHHHGGHRRA